MAGEVRQPIDIPSLERYIDQNVSEIKTPLDVKQVSLTRSKDSIKLTHDLYSSGSVNQILPTYLLRPMASKSFYARSPPASCSQRQPTKWSVNIRSSEH